MSAAKSPAHAAPSRVPFAKEDAPVADNVEVG